MTATTIEVAKIVCMAFMTLGSLVVLYICIEARLAFAFLAAMGNASIWYALYSALDNYSLIVTSDPPRARLIARELSIVSIAMCLSFICLSLGWLFVNSHVAFWLGLVAVILGLIAIFWTSIFCQLNHSQKTRGGM